MRSCEVGTPGRYLLGGTYRLVEKSYEETSTFCSMRERAIYLPLSLLFDSSKVRAQFLLLPNSPFTLIHQHHPPESYQSITLLLAPQLLLQLCRSPKFTCTEPGRDSIIHNPAHQLRDQRPTRFLFPAHSPPHLIVPRAPLIAP